MTDDVLLREAGEVISDLVGLRSTAATAARLTAALRARQAVTGLSAHAYVDRLRTDGRERQQLLERLTVQETSFFREEAQLTAFATHVLPALGSGPLTVWSAGCATGQEPYSLAMLLTEAGVTDFTIVASDVSQQALERTRRGIYRDNELRGLTLNRRDRFFTRVDGGWQIAAELRARLRLVHHNLAADPPPVGPGECGAIFCRNVFIYLRRDRIASCVGRFYDRLARNGVLFLGVSESLWPADARLTLSRVTDGVFCYRRAVDVAAAAPAPTRAATATSPAPTPRAAVRPRIGGRPVPLRVAAIDLRTDVESLRRLGESAMSEDRPAAAVEAFRKVVYLQPDDPVAHLQLGLAFEADGDEEASARSFLAARAALGRVDPATVEASMEGWSVATLAAVLDAKLGDASWR